jgi:hypothetical protein
MFTQNLSALTSGQISAIENTISSVDDLIESATTFIKNGGQSYRSFLEDRAQLITKICDLPKCK